MDEFTTSEEIMSTRKQKAFRFIRERMTVFAEFEHVMTGTRLRLFPQPGKPNCWKDARGRDWMLVAVDEKLPLQPTRDYKQLLQVS